MITFDPSYWFMFPVGIVVATVAMMSGIGGATMFTPLFLVVLKLEPAVALASGLFIEFFGFTTGVIGYIRKRCVDFSIVRQLIPYTITGTIIGLSLSFVISKSIIELLLAGILLYLSYRFLRKKKKCKPVMWPDRTSNKSLNTKASLTTLSTRDKTTSLLGASLFGVSSSGLGEVNEYTFLERLRLQPGRASGTSVMLIATSALMAALFYVVSLILSAQTDLLSTVLSIVVFAVPGVIIGANVGVQLATRISRTHMELVVGILFIVLALLIVIDNILPV